MSTNDPEFYQAPKFTPEPLNAAPKQRGCFFYGCLIAGILAILMVILVGVIAFFGYRFLGQMIEQYTSTTPRQLPKVEMPEEERQNLKDRVETFRKAVEAGTPTDVLVLTSDDLNALIEENADLKGLIHVKIEGDEVKGQVSIPLDKLEFPLVRGRYLNGEADLKASLSNGVLIVTLDSIEVNGKKVPDDVMTGIRQQNLAKDAYKDEKTSEMIRKLESLEIKDGKIILKVRTKGSATTAPSADKKEIPVEVVPPKANGVPKGEPAKKAEQPKAEPALPKS
jgi:hypothetical protein